MSGPGPLSHLTVVDLSHHVAGPYCTRLMAGFGARVIKVERPRTGDPLRALGPFVGREEGADRGIPFLWLNAAKLGVTLDLKSAKGRAIARRLVEEADVLVENFSPGVMDRLGLDDGTLASINPRLVRTSITNFGDSGPRRGYAASEMVMYALSGGMIATGDPARAPLAAGPAVTQYTAGMHAYIGTLMALVRRGDSGEGERVEVSIQESALENVEIHLVEQMHLGRTARRTDDEHPMVPWQCHPCRDGHATVMGGPIRKWLRAVPMFEEPRLLHERYRDMGGRIRHRREVEALMAPWLRRHDKSRIFHEGQARGLAFGYLAGLSEAIESPQHAARGFFRTVRHPRAGDLKVPGPPFGGGRDGWRDAPAPGLGEHNQDVYGGLLGYGREDLDRLAEEGVI